MVHEKKKLKMREIPQNFFKENKVIEHMEEADPNFPSNDYIRNKIESERSVFLSVGDAASTGAITEETVITETAVVQVCLENFFSDVRP